MNLSTLIAYVFVILPCDHYAHSGLSAILINYVSLRDVHLVTVVLFLFVRRVYAGRMLPVV